MSSGNKGLSRRQFLAGAAGAVAAPYVLAGPAKGERVNIALIGVGRRAREVVEYFARNPRAQFVTACDVNARNLQSNLARLERYQKGIKACSDFREVLADRNVDAVMIATPDHWHAVMAVQAAKAGKDIYCETPLSLTVAEARAMADAARRYGRVFQTGTWRRSSTAYQWACKAVRDGLLGEVKTVHVQAGGPSRACHLGGEKLPEGLDWDMWLGPAPDAPYHHYRCDSSSGGSYGWRAWRDYSGGYMTYLGGQHFDVVQWALSADGTGPVEIVPPDGKEHKALTYRYANGVEVFNLKGPKGATIEFTGTKGVLGIGGLAGGQYGIHTWPEDLAGGLAALDPRRINSGTSEHFTDFLDCVKSRKKPVSDVQIARRSVTVAHLGNIAYWLNRPIKWDPAKEQIVGDDQAARWLDRPRRAPWRL